MTRTILHNLRLWAALVIPALFLSACGGSRQDPDEVSIEGRLKNSRGEIMYLQQICKDSIRMVDSVKLDEEGRFLFTTRVEEAGFYILGTGMDNFVNLLLEKGEKINFSGDAMLITGDYSVSGSQGSRLLWELNKYTRMNYRKSDSLFKILDEYQLHARYDSVKFAVDSCLDDIRDDQYRFVGAFIQKNNESLASLFALYQVFGNKKVISPRDDFHLYVMLDSALKVRYPENSLVEELSLRVEAIRKADADRDARETKLDSGNLAPDFNLKTQPGTSISLSSLKGQVVLLYFWAGTSDESVQVLPLYKYLYKTYRPKGFNILGISLDKDRAAWEQAVRNHKMQWTQASDLLGWDSPLVKQYNITSLPAAFLISSDGRILCKRPDDATLSTFLGRIYKI